MSSGEENQPDRNGRFLLWGTCVVYGLVLGMGVDALRWDWTVNPQYSYGWLVPFLGGYLFLKRWPSRPVSTGLPGGPHGGAAWILWMLAALLLPLRLVQESSPDWTPVRWGMGLVVVLWMLAMLALAGGWKTALHFAWPVGFFLVAVPWPAGWENAWTQGLMQRVAAVTAEVVGWAGYSAQAQGNLISLGTGTVGVDEACSGVRSLQSLLMASIFLGELARLVLVRRLVLVVAGLGLALFFNLLRSLILVSVAIRSGLGELEKWHDSAGLMILVASLGLLLGVLRLLQPRLGDVAPPAGGAAPGILLSRGWILGLAGWLLCVQGVTEGWYLSREQGRELSRGWTVRWPREFPGYRRSPVSDQVRKVLAYEKGDGADWGERGGAVWRMFFFEWAPGRTSSQAARVHRPEVCLPATGRTLEKELQPVVVRCGGVDVPFRVYAFNNAGKPMHVFFCLWETGNQDLSDSGLSQEWSGGSRLQRAWAGRRNLGQQSLELIVMGFEDAAGAEAGFRRVASKILVPVVK